MLVTIFNFVDAFSPLTITLSELTFKYYVTLCESCTTVFIHHSAGFGFRRVLT